MGANPRYKARFHPVGERRGWRWSICSGRRARRIWKQR